MFTCVAQASLGKSLWTSWTYAGKLFAHKCFYQISVLVFTITILFLINRRLIAGLWSTRKVPTPHSRVKGRDTRSICNTVTIARYVFIGHLLVSHGLVKTCWKQAPTGKTKGGFLLTTGNYSLVCNCAWAKKICSAQSTRTCVWTCHNEPSHMLWFPTSQHSAAKWRLDVLLLRWKCSVIMMRIIMPE